MTRLRSPLYPLPLNLLAWGISLLALQGALGAGEVPKLFRIEVVEKSTGWPVPLVELRTTHNVRFVTDNAGVIAFDLPELMGVETWFDVIGHGYEVPKDGFGMRGVRLLPRAGEEIKVSVNRTMLARRIGRLTGAGLFAESGKLGPGHATPESGVLGCDSVQNAVHRGKLFWVWGDTTLARYPLGIFNATAATTPVAALASLEPPLRLPFNYFADSAGRPRGVANIPGEGPTWISGLVSLTNRSGPPQLVGTYVKIKPPMDAYESGICVWDEQKEQFDRLKLLWTKTAAHPKPPPMPEGHPVFWEDEKGKPWVLFGNPLPTLRCPATFAAWQDAAAWETLTPQTHLASATNAQAVKPHSGSIAWSPWRKRWITIFVEAFGKPSAFGEVWYAEADSPVGPWGTAVKVLSHENYTFYNPRLHPEFTPDGSAAVCFEGTFSQMFADRPPPTPRYDYNQVLYRLNLDDPALKAAATPAKP